MFIICFQLDLAMPTEDNHVELPNGKAKKLTQKLDIDLYRANTRSENNHEELGNN